MISEEEFNNLEEKMKRSGISKEVLDSMKENTGYSEQELQKKFKDIGLKNVLSYLVYGKKVLKVRYNKESKEKFYMKVDL